MPNETYTEPYDYRQYDRIWRRVNPQENPYPESRSQEETTPLREMRQGTQPEMRQGTQPEMRPEMRQESRQEMWPEIRQENVKPDAMGAILREELRHARELLNLLENSLA